MILDVTARLVASSCFIRQLNNAQIRQKYFILWRVEIMTIDKHILMCRHITDLMSIVDRVNALIENALLSPFNSTTFFVVMVRARHQNNNSNGGGRHQINHSLTQQLRHSLKQTARKKTSYINMNIDGSISWTMNTFQSNIALSLSLLITVTIHSLCSYILA